MRYAYCTLRELVYHDCTGDYVMRGEPRLLDSIAPHKTLFGAAPGKGLPIGNLNSQFFANVYLNGMDQFVKHELRCRHYVRYCDDFVLLSDSPEQLAGWRGRIETYLRDALCLELNPRQILAPVSNGVNFLGYIVRRDYLLVRRRGYGRSRCSTAISAGAFRTTRCFSVWGGLSSSTMWA